MVNEGEVAVIGRRAKEDRDAHHENKVANPDPGDAQEAAAVPVLNFIPSKSTPSRPHRYSLAQVAEHRRWSRVALSRKYAPSVWIRSRHTSSGREGL